MVSDHKNWGETGGEVGLQAAKRIMIIRHVVAENQAPEAGPKISISGYHVGEKSNQLVLKN